MMGMGDDYDGMNEEGLDFYEMIFLMLEIGILVFTLGSDIKLASQIHRLVGHLVSLPYLIVKPTEVRLV